MEINGERMDGGRGPFNRNGTNLQSGCTCGECLDGFLSARMRSSLIRQGGTMFDSIQMEEEIDDEGLWTGVKGYFLVHLDPDVREDFRTNKSLRYGFLNIIEIAVECLDAKRVPTAENIVSFCNNRSEWSPDTENYLRRAGSQMGCRAVLRYMFDAAKAEDERAGDGPGQRWSNLPTCRNDHEFEFVARACGYDR